MTELVELYRTPTLATLSEERLAIVVTDYRRELVTLARDHAYAGANWALELIDSLCGLVGGLNRKLAVAVQPPAVYVEAPAVVPEHETGEEPAAAAEVIVQAHTGARRPARVRG